MGNSSSRNRNQINEDFVGVNPNLREGTNSLSNSRASKQVQKNQTYRGGGPNVNVFLQNLKNKNGLTDDVINTLMLPLKDSLYFIGSTFAVSMSNYRVVEGSYVTVGSTATAAIPVATGHQDEDGFLMLKVAGNLGSFADIHVGMDKYKWIKIVIKFGQILLLVQLSPVANAFSSSRTFGDGNFGPPDSSSYIGRSKTRSLAVSQDNPGVSASGSRSVLQNRSSNSFRVSGSGTLLSRSGSQQLQFESDSMRASGSPSLFDRALQLSQKPSKSRDSRTESKEQQSNAILQQELSLSHSQLDKLQSKSISTSQTGTGASPTSDSRTQYAPVGARFSRNLSTNQLQSSEQPSLPRDPTAIVSVWAFKIDSDVIVNKDNKGMWHKGVVCNRERIKNNFAYEIRYYDGDREPRVPFSRIRLRVQAAVSVNSKGLGNWYNARVTNFDKSSVYYEVKFADGGTERTVPCARLRHDFLEVVEIEADQSDGSSVSSSARGLRTSGLDSVSRPLSVRW